MHGARLSARKSGHLNGSVLFSVPMSVQSWIQRARCRWLGALSVSVAAFLHAMQGDDDLAWARSRTELFTMQHMTEPLEGSSRPTCLTKITLPIRVELIHHQACLER